MRTLKKVLSLVLVLAMIMSLGVNAFAANAKKDYADYDTVSYKEAVDVMTSVGVFNGIDGNFVPGDTLTRAMAAKIITYMLLGQTQADKLVTTVAPFGDVPVSHWAAGSIAYCSNEGILAGVGDGNFQPETTLTGLSFAKMLLCALGYDAEKEGLTGDSWAINTARLVYGIKLDNGLPKDIDMTGELSREEAAQMAFTTIKKPLVEYRGAILLGNGDTAINVGSSEASYVTSTIAKEQYISTQKLTSGEYTVEFGEKYMTSLRQRSGAGQEDDFARPAHRWTNNSVEIGTYVDEVKLTYTGKVTTGTIYADLGVRLPKEDITLYIDGVDESETDNVDNGATYSFDIVRGGELTVGESAPGVLTEVFYYDETDGDYAIITQIHTYVGEVVRVTAASAARDANVTVSYPDKDVRPEQYGKALDLSFDTEDFKLDDIVLYTYSRTANAIKSMVLADVVTGNVTRVESKGGVPTKITADGTAYDVSTKYGSTNPPTTKLDYDLFMDAYGNVILAREVQSTDYVLVLASEGLGVNDSVSGGVTGNTNKVKVVHGDGTVEVLELADKDELAYVGLIATARQNSSGKYTLRPVGRVDDNNVTMQNGAAAYNDLGDYVWYDDDDGVELDVMAGDGDFELVQNRASITLSDGVTTRANSETVFVIYNNTNDKWTSYTGIKNVPDVGHANDKVVSFVYETTSGMAKIIFIEPLSDDDVGANSKQYLFVAGKSISDSTDDSNNEFFTYNAIVDGEITAIDVKNPMTQGTANALDGLYTNYRTNNDGLYTHVTAVTTPEYPETNNDVGYVVGDAGIDRISGEYTVLVGDGRLPITVDRSADMFFVNKNGDIKEISYNEISPDTNDQVWAVVKDDMITLLVIVEIPEGETAPTSATAVAPKVTGRAEYDGAVNRLSPTVTRDTISFTDLQMKLDDAGTRAPGSLTVLEAGDGKLYIPINLGTNFTAGDAYTVTLDGDEVVSNGDDVLMGTDGNYYEYVWVATVVASGTTYNARTSGSYDYVISWTHDGTDYAVSFTLVID